MIVLACTYIYVYICVHVLTCILVINCLFCHYPNSLHQPVLSFVVSGHTPLSSLEGDGERDSGEEEEEEDDDDAWIAKHFDSRRNAVLIKIHCVQTRYCMYAPLIFPHV